MSKTGANLVNRWCAVPPAARRTCPRNRRKIGTEPSAEGGRLGYRAIHEATGKAHAIIQAFYGDRTRGAQARERQKG
jgi:hypothetical protein